MADITQKEITKANRAAWNASAPLHGEGKHWEQLLENAAHPGFSVLDPFLTATLEGLDLKGKSAVQIGCNNARELISLASLGILPEMGIDQASGFLAQAKKLADAAGLDLRLLEADIYELPSDVGQFDLALITIGVLNWMPDLSEFFRITSGLLAPGGRLVIYETHPFMEVFDPASSTPFEPAFSYFERQPQTVTEAITYDGEDHGEGETGYWFIHPLGEIITACAQSGLGIIELREYGHTIREPKYDIYEGRSAQIPMSYCLVARKVSSPQGR
ncbi:SAM-dependent methyltransferase (plasmid) [Thioclava nitratireducens]|uniref:SAM-dependent methyltransferase n=1 Tax=Thioclava nitratireducens TaxID=1915078 RepID=A0ABN4XL26_9RHOB|nr:class I SAM-dependent methyltransferase [Thioclava nitratireducens]AQS50296.1 SAM-dependent methyltransferase [Thioclava nitratireducens]